MQQMMKDSAGNVWSVDAQGVPTFVSGPPQSAPSASGTGIGIDPSKARAESRAERADARATARDDRQARIEERRLAIAEAEERRKQTGGTGKAMRQGDADHLEKQINAYAYLKNSVGSFDDAFAGNTVTGELENWAQGKFNTGTPGQRDWWANFRTADNLIRNELFGASLTAGEKSAYAATTIDPSMSPEIVRQNLTRREQIAKDILSRRVSRLHSTYNKDEVESALGEYRDELLAPKAGGSPAAPGAAMEVATGDTKVERSQSEQDKKIASMLARGASAADIKRAANGQYPKLDSVLAWRALNPKYKGGYDVSTERVVPTTMLNKAMASPLATIATQAVNAASGGLLDEAGGAVQSLVTGAPLANTIAAADLAKQAQAKLNPNSALAGNVLGGAAAMVGGGALLSRAGLGGGAWAAANPIRAGLLADGAYGAAYGAGENNNNRLMGGAVGGAAGVVGNRIGAGLTRGLGGVARGVVNPAVERLRAKGIDPTGGEILGGWVKGVEDRLEGFPLVGDMLARRNATSRRQLNEAAFNEGGQQVGTDIKASGMRGLELLDRAKSNAYDAALNPVSIDANDPSFLANMGSLVAATNRIPPVNGAREAAAAAIESRIGGAVDPATDTISGRGFQEAYRGLARTAKERASSDYGHEVGQVMRQGQDALASALPPEALGGFLRANSANRHLSILTDAVNAAKSQLDNGDALFTPAQLGTAATSNTKKFGGKLSAAIGDRPFDQLARDAQEIMSSKVGDSGTAGRWALGAALGLGGTGGYASGGGEGAATGAGATLAPVAVMAALNTRAGQAAITRALLQRTAAFRNLGQGVVNAAPRVGNFTGLLSVLGSQSALPPR